MLTGRSLAALSLACGLLSITSSQLAGAYTVKVDATKTTHASWDGWGTSLSWWANHWGKRVDIADALFTLKLNLTVNGDAKGLPGLGFNIVRYNIGGSSKNVIDNAGKEVAMRQASNMAPFKFIDSFWIDWFNADPASASWNWNADLNQRDMLALAIERGANVLEAFVKSPPWWMNKNHATAGGDQVNVDNLTPHNHRQYALYLATVLRKFKTDWNVNFHFIEPFSTPTAPGLIFPYNQEGCYFSVSTQMSFLWTLRKQLDEFGLQDIAITAPDENSPEDTHRTLYAMARNRLVVSTFAKVNTQNYSGKEPYRGTYREVLRGLSGELSKKLWDSAFGDKDGSGLTMAESICLDINVMGAVGIAYWQALDSGGWGLIESNPGDNWMGKANPKYFVMAQFTRHIRPGMKILASDDKMTVVGFDDKKNTIVLVTVNMGDSQIISYDLTSFGPAERLVNVWTTDTSGTGPLYLHTTFTTSSTLLHSNTPSKSVKTFELTMIPHSA